MITTHRLPSKNGPSDPFPAVVPVAIRLERNLDHRPGLVFDAYADVDQRVRWSSPPDEVVEYTSDEFRVGGTDQYLRNRRDHPSVAGTTCYEQIVDERRIVFTERLLSADGLLLALSLVTWTLAPAGSGALLVITDQTTSVVGSGPIEGCRHCYDETLDRLTRHLAGSID